MKYFFPILLIFISTLGFGQNSKSEFLKDLDFVYENLKTTSSYKTQKNKQKMVEVKYEELKKQHSSIPTFESLIKLYELVDIIYDYHNEIYGNTDDFEYEDLKKEDFLSKIKTESQYNFYPKTAINLDSLESELTNRKLNDYEGIYHYKNYFKLAIVKRNDSLLEGIVLETKIPSWQRGETMLYLLHKQENRFRLFSGQFINKRLFSMTDRFVNGEFKMANWKKIENENDFYNANFPKEKYVEKKLNENCTYIKLGSFNSTNQGVSEATNFYNQIKNNLTSKNLIVDLRNNSGGGNKSSEQFFKLFKKYKGNIFILMNFYTVSNAEQFAVKMRKLKNVTLIGDNTKGMITYGRNYPEDKETPSKKFRIYFSDLDDNWKTYLKYEGIGIEPDFRLTLEEDWIEQTLKKYCN